MKNCVYVDNICVYGDSKQLFVIALVVPNMKALKSLSEGRGKTGLTVEQMCKDKGIIDGFQKAMAADGAKAKLHKTEIPAKIHLCKDPWTANNGLMTAALKLKRKNIYDYYKKEINQLYGIVQNGNTN